MDTSMREDFEKYYREQYLLCSDYDAVEIYGTYAKSTPENEIPAYALSNPADIVHVKTLNEISKEELIDIVSNGPNSKRSSKQASPGTSYHITPNSSFKFEGSVSTGQIRPFPEAKASQLEEENRRLTTKVRILEENSIREREEWMNKYFDHLRECKSRKGDADKRKSDVFKERDLSEKLKNELMKSKAETEALRRELKEKEKNWEETIKELKEKLACEKLKTQENMVGIRQEFSRIQQELDRVRTRGSKLKSSDNELDFTRKLQEKDRSIRVLESRILDLQEAAETAKTQIQRLKQELKHMNSSGRDLGDGNSTRRSVSTKKQSSERDVTPYQKSTRLLATKKGRSFSGANHQSKSSKDLQDKTEVRTEDLSDSIMKMEARIALHRDKYLSRLHSKSDSAEDLRHLSQSLGQEEEQLSQLRQLREEQRRRKR